MWFSEVAMCCAALHNICRRHNDVYDEAWNADELDEGQDDGEQQAAGQEPQDACHIRDVLAHHIARARAAHNQRRQRRI